MASTTEIGHGKNLANFNKLITILSGFSEYQPTKAAIQIPELEVAKDKAKAAFQLVTTKNAAFNHIVNLRQAAFSDLKSLSTRLVNALDASEASDAKVKDAKTIQRKINGRRAAGPTAPIDPDTPAPNTISVSQQSYDKLVEHFGALIALLQTETSYNPNETALQMATLTTKIQALLDHNSEVNHAYTELSNARIQRNDALYHPEEGIVHLASEAKKYVKSLYGPVSQQFKLITGIQIRRLMKLTHV